jgi:DNA-binding transcriptional ArsR family regulator
MRRLLMSAKRPKRQASQPPAHEGPPYLGPVTEAAYMARDRKAGTPPPIIEEWNKALEAPGFVLLLAGAWRGASEPGKLSWGHLIVSSDGPPVRPPQPGEPEPMPPTRDARVASKVERLLAPLAHESRVRILQVLSEGSHSSSQLSVATGLTGGNLYHHLRDLVHAGYVRELDRGYALTNVGLQLLLTVTCIAWEAVEDRDADGLVIGDTW